MNHIENSNFYKGIGVGIMVGSAVGMAVKTTRPESKNAWGKTLKSMGEVVENVSSVLGF